MAKYTNLDHLLTLLQTRTQKEAAEILGVSDRTIRRWKNENVKPTKPHAKILQQKAAQERIKLYKQGKRKGLEKPFDTPHLKVPPVGYRRKLKDFIGYRWTGKYYLSDWVNYDVRKWTALQMFDLIAWARNDERWVQIIYDVPRGGTSLGGREYSKGGRAATTTEALIDWTDLDIWEWLNEILTHDSGGKNLRVRYIAVLDKSRTPSIPKKVRKRRK